MKNVLRAAGFLASLLPMAAISAEKFDPLNACYSAGYFEGMKNDFMANYAKRFIIHRNLAALRECDIRRGIGLRTAQYIIATPQSEIRFSSQDQAVMEAAGDFADRIYGAIDKMAGLE